MVDVLVLTSLNQLVFALKKNVYLCYRASYLIEEVNCTQPSPSVSVPCLDFSKWYYRENNFKCELVIG
jgi:hypothetical protein